MKSKEQISVIIADDYVLVREGLETILAKEPSVTLLAAASDGRELVSLVETHRPDVVLTDLVMPHLDGIEATRLIRQVSPLTEVIALSMFDDESMVVDVIEAGAVGYLLKNADKSDIFAAIQAGARHEHYYCREISLKLAKYVSRNRSRQQKPVITFTPKELEVIRYICMEFTSHEIGKELYQSKRTIDGYRSDILGKINAKGPVGIVIYAIQNNLFTPGEAV